MKIKRHAASSQPEKLIRKSAEDIQRYVRSPKFKSDAARVAAMRDEEIDYSDIPELTDEELALFRPVKQAVTTRIDADVLFWLKSKPGRYQSTLNAELRKAMERERAAAAPNR